MEQQQEQTETERPVLGQTHAWLVECVVWQKSRNMVASRTGQRAIHRRAMRPHPRGLVVAGVKAKGHG